MANENGCLLSVEALVTGYGKKQVLAGVDLEVRRGEIVALIGHNGAGKSTLLRAVFGLLPVWDGRVCLDGRKLETSSPRGLLRAGVAYVPQGNRVFTDLTVRENLEMGGVTLPRERSKDGVERALSLFPALIEQGQIMRRNHEVVVADGPANLADSTRALLLVADFALVPCGVTVPELESTADTIRILRNAQAVRPPGLPSAMIVLGRLRDDRFSLTREAPLAAQTLGLPVCRHVLRLRDALADAPGQRTVVWRMGYRAKPAATEMQNVIMEVMQHGQEATKHDRYADGGTRSVSSSG